MVNRFYIFVAIVLVKNIECDDSTQECPVKVNQNGLLEAYCSNRGLPLVPSKIPAHIQVLDLSNNSNLRFTPNAFRRYGETLIHLKLSHISDVFNQRIRQLAPLDIFLTLYKLEIFEFTYSNLTDDEMWKFPANLRKLVLDGNNYTYLDVSTGYKLQEISANDNKLKKLPISHQPAVDVMKYSLKNNPLDELTVSDLAPLCNLNILELEIPQGAFLSSSIGNCRCRQIMKWAELFNISGAHLACSNLTDSKCDFNFDQYIKMRETCPRTEDVPQTYKPSYSHDGNFMNAVAKKLPSETYLNVVIGFFLACTVIFVVYKVIQRFSRNSASGSRKKSRKSKDKKKSKPTNELGDEEEDDEIAHRF